MPGSFDGVLMVAFGGPQGPADVRPFLANVLRGRRVSPDRIDEVAHHYELFGGISPLTEWTMRQAEQLRHQLMAAGHTLPVYVGMRNWHPFLADTLAQMSRDGVRRVIGVLAAAHRSYSGCTQYRENVDEARRQLREAGLADVEVTYVGDWHLSRGFVGANASAVVRALERLDARVRDAAQLVFTAHSIPVTMAERYPYAQQLGQSCEAVALEIAKRLGSTDPPHWRLVYQSRSGRPEDPWLGPDVNDHLETAARDGVPAVVLCPIGFICDHVEVLYDLDVEAAATAGRLGLPIVRASTVNADEEFVSALAESVCAVVDRHRRGRPLPITR